MSKINDLNTIGNFANYGNTVVTINGLKKEVDGVLIDLLSCNIPDSITGKTRKKVKALSNKILGIGEGMVKLIDKGFIDLFMGGKYLRYEGKGYCFVQFNSQGKTFYINSESINFDNMDIVDSGVNVVTGSCMFSTDYFKGIYKDNTKTKLTSPYEVIDKEIIGLEANENLSLYELDYVLKVVRGFLANTNYDLVKNYYLQLPSIEYYFYLADAYNDGFVPSSIMFEYFGNIDARASKIFDMILKNLPDGVKSKVSLKSPLDPVLPYIIDKIKLGEKIDLDQVKLILKEIYVDLNYDFDSIVSFKDLCNFSYVCLYMMASSNLPLIAIEDSDETTIFTKSKSLIVENSLSNSIMGIFLHTNIVPNDGNLLYFTETSPTFSNVKIMINSYLYSNISKDVSDK